MKRVLITDLVHEKLIEGFEAAGFHCDYDPDISLEAVHKIVSDYEGIIINTKIKTDQNLLDKASRLEFIGRLGSGLEIIDLEYAKSKNIRVVNSPEGNRNAVAEQAIGMLLALSNHLIRGDREVRDFHWDREKNRGFEISGLTMGIIGFGNTGSSLAKRLRGFDMNILAYDKYRKDYEKEFPYVKETDLKEIHEKADIISFHLPLTSETLHFMDKGFIDVCKKPIIIINTSRGKVLKTKDLILGLKSGKIRGACLDVFENEKVKTFTEEEITMYKSLYTMENVVLSPHVAGWTIESKRKIAEVLLDKILPK